MAKYNYRRTDLWECVECGDVFGRHDQWFEEDICETCINKDE